MKTTTRGVAMGGAAAVAALVLSLTGCASSQPAAGGTDEPAGDPIPIGAIASLTGPAVFPEASSAAKAYFDVLNASGGIAGRPVEYIVQDDGGDPAKAAQAAKTLIEDDEVVLLGGAGSLLQCAVNAEYLAQQGVVDVPGTGVDPGCFASAAISPVNTGPYMGVTVSLFYLSEERGIDKICYVQQSVPAFNPAFEGAVAHWMEVTGKELAAPVQFVNPTDDLTPVVSTVRASGCEAVFFSLNEAPLVALLQAAVTQGLDDEVVFMSQTSGFTDGIATAVGASGQGLLANSEFLPYNSDSPELDEWRTTMEAAGVPLTSFAQGGYLAAKIIADTLASIDGEITRESVTEAFHALTSFPTPWMGSDYAFGPGDTHASNTASMIVELKDGAWTTVTGEWVRLPD
ncbi:MAG: ABC transporter substrate-binding protein [Actinomycetota bacterium]|nr:ABC transporter substrate-binding protein [Actinomycetota bacterium]